MNSENITLKQFLGNLKVGQFWGLLGTVSGLIAGAFALGYKVNSMVTDPQLAARDAQLTAARLEIEKATADLKKTADQTGAAGTKERFLSLYLRYLIAVRANAEPAEQDEARQAFDDFIRQFVDSKELIIHKGGGRLATIKFSDGTSWEIPRELHVTMKN